MVSNCPFCNTEFLYGWEKCYVCGWPEKNSFIINRGTDCPRCHFPLPDGWKKCYNCSFPDPVEKNSN